MLVSVVIVNYESWPDVLRLVEALGRAPEIANGAAEVLIVDNASRGPIPNALEAPGPGFRLILRPENGGFAAGVNAGWRESRSPWLLLLNPDVELGAHELGQIVGRARRYESDPNDAPGVVGFRLLNADGSPQSSIGAFPSLPRALWEPLLPRSRRKAMLFPRHGPGPVPWVTGACALVNARLLGVLGGMDEDFFLYYEEVALCRLAHRLGWQVEYDPRIAARHLRPLHSRPVSDALRVITRHSKLLYFRKHLPRWHFLGLCEIVLLEAEIRAAWCSVRGLRAPARTWRMIGTIARELRAGETLRGRDVRARAETANLPGQLEVMRKAS